MTGTGLVPVKDYAGLTVAQMQAHAASLKARLYGLPARPVVHVPPAPDRAKENARARAARDARRWWLRFEAARRAVVVPPAPWEEIVGRVAAAHGYSLTDILSPRRDTKLVFARQDAMLALQEARPLLSLPTLGRLFHRDHSTVLHGLRRARKRRGW